ncbi:hypothetical protein BC833DRAFT_433865 [Globomyces pollinis-pini]|nr:hypothetical protein BC833DRAFT_433865 [Globomyces pollinis-pini]
MGFRYLINSLQNVELHGELVSEKLYNVNRISLGVPEGPADFVPDVSLPLECNVDLMAVDFNKGCYLGQELTIRTHHTGVIRKRIYPFQALANDGEDFRFIAEPDLAESGSDILYEGKKVGKVGSVIGNIGLGLFRTEHLGKELYLENGTLIRPVPKN